MIFSRPCEKKIDENYRLELILTVWTGRLKSHVKDRYIAAGLLCPAVIPFLDFETKSQSLNATSLLHDPRRITQVFTKDHKSVIHKFQLFYLAPITKFWANFFTFIAFLLLFSEFMISHARYESVGVIECILMTYVTGYAIEEIFQLHESGDCFSSRVKNYFTPDPNKLDAALLCSFIFTFLVRFLQYDFLWGLSAVYLTDILYVTSLLLGFVRILFFVMIKPSLGPYIIMLQFMIKDLYAFLVILVSAVLGFGVAMEALLVANVTDKTLWNDIWGFMIKPSMQMYGFDLFLEDIATAFNCSSADEDDVSTNVLRLVTFWRPAKFSVN